MSQLPSAFWSISASDLLQYLHASPEGLTSQEAQRRLTGARGNLLKPAKRADTLTLLLAQFMNVLYSDKTGTLTEGVVHLHSALDIDGDASDKVLPYAYLTAFYETGFINPIDEVTRAYRQFDLTRYQKLGEAP